MIESQSNHCSKELPSAQLECASLAEMTCGYEHVFYCNYKTDTLMIIFYISSQLTIFRI